MKHLLIFFVLIGTIGSGSAQYIGNSEDTGLIWPPICLGGSACPPYEEWVKGIFNNAISEPFDKSDTVLVGTIIQVENQDSHFIRYSIDVEFYLKNVQPFDSLSATLDDPVEPESFPDVLLYNSSVFEKDDLVFVYLKKVDGSYKVLLQSFAIDKHEVRGPPPTIIYPTDPYQRNFEQGEEVVISGIVRKAELYNVAKQGETLDVKVTIHYNDKIISDDSVGIDSDGRYSYKFHTIKTPPGTYDIDVNFGPSTIGDRIIIEPNLKYWTPLKQFKSGITIEETQCRESLTLVTKYDKSPACVKPESIPKLVERGWIYSESKSKNCSDGLTFNEVLFKCVITCDGDLVYNGFTNTCTKYFELRYHGFCNDGFIYNPSSHECISNVDGFSQHKPLKDPPRTPPPEPVFEPEPEK